jgi:hypothetical protein
MPSFAPTHSRKISNFLKCRPKKSLERENPIDNDMNIAADDRISKTGDFANQFVLFPTLSGPAILGEQPPSRLSREQMDAFLKAASDNARSAHFVNPPPEAPAATPEKDLAAGVLKQAAHDLRRFRAATKGVKRELYLDAYGWITAYDFSWPYSFVNVCKSLDVCPEIIRTELLADASLGWLDYWTKRAGGVSRKLRASFAGVFAGCRNADIAEPSELASCI